MRLAIDGPGWVGARAARVRVEITGLQKCRIVGKSQAVLIMIDPMISVDSLRAPPPP
eukprot:COSAG01_NODE_36723_length_513_cov_1.154589_2_plen_56_part_01